MSRSYTRHQQLADQIDNYSAFVVWKKNQWAATKSFLRHPPGMSAKICCKIPISDIIFRYHLKMVWYIGSSQKRLPAYLSHEEWLSNLTSTPCYLSFVTFSQKPLSTDLSSSCTVSNNYFPPLLQLPCQTALFSSQLMAFYWILLQGRTKTAMTSTFPSSDLLASSVRLSPETQPCTKMY